MSRTAFWILALASVGLLAAGTLFYLNLNPEPEAPPMVTPDPFGSTNDGVIITAVGGEDIRARDFVNDGETEPDPGNPGTYFLAGYFGYCDGDEECEPIATSDFNIKYDSKIDAFTIGLATEPIGEVRKRAEAFLMKKLGIGENDMCALNYYVGTSYWVNETYSGGNLGWSFCPGSIALPD
ncbi:MAG: hypothetical protein KBC38_00245 [Candidatus Pacebacteria bacterium]|nr:hypothetical protein [Candidatus Paceibacterota bacterium]MBP9840428.1 hypothetical protein [Candidatus Paceibacterota bacterium]